MTSTEGDLERLRPPDFRVNQLLMLFLTPALTTNWLRVESNTDFHQYSMSSIEPRTKPGRQKSPGQQKHHSSASITSDKAALPTCLPPAKPTFPSLCTRNTSQPSLEKTETGGLRAAGPLSYFWSHPTSPPLGRDPAAAPSQQLRAPPQSTAASSEDTTEMAKPAEIERSQAGWGRGAKAS